MTHGLRALGLLRSSTSKIGLFREENEEEDEEEDEEEEEDDDDGYSVCPCLLHEGHFDGHLVTEKE